MNSFTCLTEEIMFHSPLLSLHSLLHNTLNTLSPTQHSTLCTLLWSPKQHAPSTNKTWFSDFYEISAPDVARPVWLGSIRISIQTFALLEPAGSRIEVLLLAGITDLNESPGPTQHKNTTNNTWSEKKYISFFQELQNILASFAIFISDKIMVRR